MHCFIAEIVNTDTRPQMFVYNAAHQKHYKDKIKDKA